MGDVQYARAEDGTHVAYRLLEPAAGCEVGNDLVMVSGGLFPMEVFEDDPGSVRLLEGLRTLGRVVIFDRRGIGLSDPIADWTQPVLDLWAEDLSSVVEACGFPEPVVFAWDNYGVATRFASRHPDRLRLLVLDQPVCVADEHWDHWVKVRLGLIRENTAGRRTSLLDLIAPSRVSDASFRDWYGRAGRLGASPATAERIWESVFKSRPRDQLLDQVTVPTLVLYRRDDAYTPADTARLAASEIAGSTVVELDGADHFPFSGDIDAIVAEIAEFVVGERRLPPPERLLAAVMFTDLVDSTGRVATLGDAKWKSVLDRHDLTLRRAVGHCGGTVVKSTGDGVLALLPSAAAAVRAATRVRDELAADGLGVRIGIHVGDVDRRGDDVSGLAVHFAARAMHVATSGDVIVTGSALGAIAGQAKAFESLGTHELRGIPGRWELFRLIDAHTSPP